MFLIRNRPSHRSARARNILLDQQQQEDMQVRVRVLSDLRTLKTKRMSINIFDDKPCPRTLCPNWTSIVLILTQEPAWDQEVGPIPSSSFSREVQYNTVQCIQYSTVYRCPPRTRSCCPPYRGGSGPGPRGGVSRGHGYASRSRRRNSHCHCPCHSHHPLIQVEVDTYRIYISGYI